MVTRAERQRIRYQEKRARGECKSCKEPVKPGHVMCEYHLKEQNARLLARRNRLRSAGRCVVCGDPAIKGQAKCAVCQASARASEMARYYAYKAKGVCPWCRKRKARPGRVSCGPCGRYAVELWRKKRTRQQRLRQFRIRWQADPDTVATRLARLLQRPAKG